MARNIKTIKVLHINVFIKESIIKGVNSIKLINIKVKISYNYYKSFKNTYNKYNSIYVLRSRLLKIFINYKLSFTSSKETILIYLISKNLYY
jgi:hypothetical protein